MVPLVKQLVQMVKLFIPMVPLVQMLPTNGTIGEPQTHALLKSLPYLSSTTILFVFVKHFTSWEHVDLVVSASHFCSKGLGIGLQLHLP